ncbi:MAG TPA: MBL fold metallo-hydrolase [Thermoanaerobaculia bacterium]|jgi:glyoxylase-like metal-dependent hydrolase (beta-lactamase superfamily II)|nr:MBL fold metallo-hydrolase [Thermoanaerobaculia bacterium]
MMRATCVRLLAGLALAMILVTAPVAAQQQDFSKVEIKVVPVAGNIYMLVGAGGNIGVSAGSDGILIVDDQYAPLAERIRAALQSINAGQSGKLKFVLNTHLHGDHTGGNATFGPEAPIIAQENVRKRLMTEQHVMGTVMPPSPAEALPVITFQDSVSVHFNGEEIKVIHYPHGHTDGDSVIFFTKSNVVHMGDDFFNTRFPFVDLESGGSVQGMTAGVAKVLAQIPADAKVIPGHGPLSTVEDLKTYHRMLVETTGIVQKQIKAGKTLTQIQTMGLPDQWKPWGGGFIDTKAWIETVYTSLLSKIPDHPVKAKHH